MTIRIIPATHSPVGKLADAELLFDGRDGILFGLKITGFAVYKNRRGLNVTLPPGRTGLPVLRATAGDDSGLARVRDAITRAWFQFEAAHNRNVTRGQRGPASVDMPVPPRGWESVDTSVEG